jgi:pimeloyl-ACP methyl ester carboxylesterase
MGATPSTPVKAGRAYSEEVWGEAPGEVVHTTMGTTHYILEGEGPLVILLHDIGSGTAVYDKISNDLVSSGFRVLRYDLYDHGYSETDPQRYPIEQKGVHPLPFNMKIHVQQLRDVLQTLELENTDCCLFGHGIGGLVAILFAAAHPEIIQGLILINSSCLPGQKPLGDDWYVKLMGTSTFKTFVEDSNSSRTLPQMKDFFDKQRDNASENARFWAALTSTNLHCALSAETEFRMCCASQIPIHLIWGKSDRWLRYKNCVKMKDIASEAGTEVSEDSFDGLPHNVFLDAGMANEISQCIIHFLEQSFLTISEIMRKKEEGRSWERGFGISVPRLTKEHLLVLG